MGRVVRQLKHSWNAFKDAPTDVGYGGAMTMNPRASRPSSGRLFADRSFISAIYNRMALDFASIEFFHAQLDENDIATKIIRDPLQECLSLSPNIDQSAQALKIDYAMTQFETGHACLVPVEATMDPLASGSYDIQQMRVGTVAGWSARKVRLNVYDDRETDKDGAPVNGGVVKQIVLPKENVVIVENPLYTIMNEPNGMLQRLLAKWAILDKIDELQGTEKLDMIFQLPYTVRGESRKKQAEERRQLLSDQLQNDPLGIGYIDVSEKVIQLNRPVVNKLLEEIQELQTGVMAELGITREIMNGTADRNAINNYYDRTIEPLAEALRLETKRKFLTKTARTQRHSIEIYRDPLKIIPIDELAEVADKLIRNAVVTANEFRPKIGYRPSDQPGANKLQNPNMPEEDQPSTTGPPTPEEVPDVNG